MFFYQAIDVLRKHPGSVAIKDNHRATDYIHYRSDTSGTILWCMDVIGGIAPQGMLMKAYRTVGWTVHATIDSEEELS